MWTGATIDARLSRLVFGGILVAECRLVLRVYSQF
jgi:hypothetical protein